MSALCRVAASAALCCLAAGAGAQAQQQAARIDATVCAVGDETTAIEGAPAYRALGIRNRGTVRASEPGGAFDNAATLCVGTAASLGGGPVTASGYCEWATSAEDRALYRWTAEAGAGRSEFIGGTGRFRGISGEATFRPIAPVPSREPGVFRFCNRVSGEFRLP